MMIGLYLAKNIFQLVGGPATRDLIGADGDEVWTKTTK
jgi:hypothetical protein|tara:strand:- start:224 stop:337 length:114 start_codon:yes stop_codon:yes gene_type:complete